MTKLAVGVIGVGRLGSIHAEIYRDLRGVRLAGVCDIDPTKAEAIGRRSGATAYTDYRRLLPHVQAVSIAVPTTLHYPIAAACLQHGIHVLIEKPITDRVAHADRLLALARRHRLVLQVGHVERFNPAVRLMRRIARRPRFIEVHRLGPYPYRSTDISVVLDLMIHDIDIVRALVGAPLRRLDAVGVRVLSDSEDIANARLIFANGAVANLTASRVTTETLRKIRVFQSNTYLSLDYAARRLAVYQLDGRRIRHREVAVAGPQPLQAELAAFISAVRSKRPSVGPAEEARDALAIAKQIEASIRRTNQSSVAGRRSMVKSTARTTHLRDRGVGSKS